MAEVTESTTYFRQDIQGLRAIAILLVVTYHTGIAFPGGYIGVDMFFVISGFVITQLLSREYTRTGTLRLSEFYSRRVRRILPAVAFATIGTLLISVVALSPFGEQQQVVDTSRASSFFGSNLYFYMQDSYWALAENPLRHLWSLAVEEQFYLIFPILIILLRVVRVKISSGAMRISLLTISVISFVGSYYLSNGNQFLPKPELMAFFGTPWRMWEFLVGSILALSPTSRRSLPQIATNLFATVSLIVILWAAVTFNSFTIFPGTAAIAPVFSTAILIYLGTNSSATTRLLAIKPLIRIGTISFSWYLWHWPLIVFAHRLSPNSHYFAPISAAIFSAGFAIISLRLIENPIRHNPEIRGKRALKLGVVCTIAPILVSVVVQFGSNSGLGLREIKNDEIKKGSFADVHDCRIDKGKAIPNCDGNEFGSTAKRLLLVGDSAATASSDGVAAATHALGMNFSAYYSYGCPIILKPVSNRTYCITTFPEIEKKIAEIKPDILVISNMSSIYVDNVSRGEVLRDLNGKPAADVNQSIAIWISMLRQKINNDFKNQKTLVILQPPMSNMRDLVLLQKLFDEKISLKTSEIRNRITRAESELFRNYENFVVVDPATTLCDGVNCKQTLNGQALYYDSLHLTVKGSLLLTDAITVGLKQLTAKK